MRVEDALERYVTQLRADGRSEHTVRQVARHVRALARWMDGPENDIGTLEDTVLARFLGSDAALLRPDGKPKKATATNALRSSMRTFFSYLHAAGLLARNPARLLRRARCAAPPPRALTGDDRDRLLAALDRAETAAEQRDATLFHLMLGTAVRLGSALALDVEDVDLDEGVLRVRTAKGGAGYRAFVPRDLVGRLRRHLGDRTSGPLFQGPGGRRISARHAQRRFAELLKRAGLPASRAAGTHTLRHTRATELYRSTGDLLLVKEVLGHRSIASTLVYTRVDEGKLRAAVGV